MKHQPTVTECIERYIRRYYHAGGTIPFNRIARQLVHEGDTHSPDKSYHRIAYRIIYVIHELAGSPSDLGTRVSTDDMVAVLQLIREQYHV